MNIMKALWNGNFRALYGKRYYLLGEETVNRFYRGEPESRAGNSVSIYGHFRNGHDHVRNLFRCARETGCQNSEEILNKARQFRDYLYAEIDDFLVRLNNSYDYL